LGSEYHSTTAFISQEKTSTKKKHNPAIIHYFAHFCTQGGHGSLSTIKYLTADHGQFREFLQALTVCMHSKEIVPILLLSWERRIGVLYILQMHNYANLPKLGNRDQNNLLSVDCQLHYHLRHHHRKALDMGSMYFSHSWENYENEKERKKHIEFSIRSFRLHTNSTCEL